MCTNVAAPCTSKASSAHGYPRARALSQHGGLSVRVSRTVDARARETNRQWRRGVQILKVGKDAEDSSHDRKGNRELTTEGR